MRRSSARYAERHAELVLETVLRLSVLLAAGLDPARAWAGVGDEPRGARDDRAAREVRAVTTAAARAAAEGADVARALRCGGAPWQPVAAMWCVATACGAPLAATLRSAVGALRDAREIRDEVRVALAEPRSTSRLLTWLPVLGVPLGAALGFDTVSVLLGEPLGLACAGCGAGLILASRIWTGRCVATARPSPEVPGLRADLCAIAVAAGLPITRARDLVDEALDPRGADLGARDAGVPERGVPHPRARSPRAGAMHPRARRARAGARRCGDAPAVRSARTEDEVDHALALSERTGAPARDLLQCAAWLARQRARSSGRLAAARLSTRLLLPLGVCTLPAFLLLTVAPMMLAIVRSHPLTV